MTSTFKKMKYPILTLAIFLSISTSQAIESKEEFKASVIRTLNDKDWSGYLALTFKEGMNDYDFKTMGEMEPIIFNEKIIIDGEFTNLPKNHTATFVYDNRMFSQTIKAQGLLILKYESESEGDLTLQYAKHGEDYVIVTSKSQKLDWDGPDDVPLSIMIIGHDHENLKVEGSWNISGVSVTEELSYMSTNFNGQYIEEVTITSDDPDAVYQLKILQAGKEVFDSKPRKGVGEIKYQRDVNKSE
jgi:hypothetical protein